MNLLSGKKIIYLVTEDWYFCSHRLPIARAAREAGLEVLVATRVRKHGAVIEEEGFRLLPLKMRRQSKNPIREINAVLELISVYRRERPDIVHHVALKPVLYGSLAARFTRVPNIINALAGLGYVFSSEQSRARIIKMFVRLAFKMLISRPNSHVLLQNPDDRQVLIDSNIVLPERTTIIRGSGVDIRRFIPFPEPGNTPIVVTLVARMIKDKGIAEFVDAAKILINQGVPFMAVLVGIPDPENPNSITEKQLNSWQEEGWVSWWRQQEDIPSIWARSHIAVLPSYYGEGVPLSLIEAAACGKPIITTDMPGCREIVKQEENGLLIPPRNSNALAEAIKRLVESPDQRKKMGEVGRQLVEREFSEEVVISKTMGLYQAMLKG